VDRKGLGGEEVTRPDRKSKGGRSAGVKTKILICRFDNSRRGKQRRIAFLDSAKSAPLLKRNRRMRSMSRLSVVLLLVTSLVLTVYFGAAAWRITEDSPMDITGHIPPAAK